MADEYDFKGAQRGKYANRYAEGTNLVRLDPDVAAVFRDSETTNRALRSFIEVMRQIRAARVEDAFKEPRGS